MLLRHLLGDRILRAPNDDTGHEEPDDQVEGTDEPGADEGVDDALDLESDDGSEDHGADDDDGADDGSQDRPTADEVRRPSRAQARVETALREAREAREEAARLRAEREAERRQVDHTAVQRERQARLEAMDPYERQQFLNEERLRAQDERLARIEFNSVDAADRTDFAGQCARNPALAAVADDVEKELRRIRGNGQNVDRLTVAKYLLGDRALARGGAAKTRQGNKGAAAIGRQAARPTGARSDVRDSGGARGDTQAARAKRLEGLSI